MSPELITAIKERIQNNHPKEVIKTEVMAMGHTEQLFEAAYVLALHDANVSNGATPVTQSTGKRAELTSIHTLVKESFSFACERWGMAVLLGVPSVLLAVLAALQLRYEDSLTMNAVLSGVSLVVMFIYFVNILSVLYLISRGEELEKNTYKEAFAWTKSNIFGIFSVYFLTVLAVLGGFVLFIIPGFVVLITLYFSQYIYVVEGKKGLSALVRSRDLVKGHWFQIFKKVFGLTLYFLIPVFIFSFAAGIVDAFYSLEKYVLLGEIALQVLAAFFAVMSMQIMFRLYRELATATPDVSASKGSRFFYGILAVIGFISIPVIIALIIFTSGIEGLKETMVEPASNTESSLDVRNASVVAEEYFIKQGSYTGVCSEIGGAFDAGEEIKCNETNDSWAVSVKEGEEFWCIDSMHSVPKRVQSEIGEKTECIVVE